MLDVQSLGNGITCIDTGYVRPQMTACYLLEHQGQVAFIDTGVNNNVPGLLSLLESKGLSGDQVKYIIPTHVHLDHAGGAGQLMQALPEASLVIHPRGARHMIDPSALIAGTSAVYGEDKFAEMYGELISVDKSRVLEAPDEFTLQLGDRTLLFLDTPGHARHHFCIYDEISQGIFSGDTFGLSYREFDHIGKVFSMPTTTPVQFEPAPLHASIDRLLSFQPKRVYLTHFGCIEDVTRAADQLHTDIDQYAAITRDAMPEGTQMDDIEAQKTIETAMYAYTKQRLSSFAGESIDRAMRLLGEGRLNIDITLNTQGLIHWRRRALKQKGHR